MSTPLEEFSEQSKKRFAASLKKVIKQREQIVKAFCAEFGCMPSQCCQITKHNPDGSLEWRVVKLEQRPKEKSLIIKP